MTQVLGQRTVTNLQIKCPRCGRIGQVVLEKDRDEPRRVLMVVVWAARAADGEWAAFRQSEDICDLSDLLRPTFGCGYDIRSRR
jgi:hypothetical protein